MTTIRKTLVVAAIAVGFALAGCSAAPLATTMPPPVVTVQPQASTPVAPPPSVTPPAVTTPAKAEAVGVAQEVTVSDMNDTVTGTAVATVHSATWSQQPQQSYGGAPKHAFLIIDVSFKGETGRFQFNPFMFTARDSMGRGYEAEFGGAPDPELHDGYTEPGDLARGFVAFDLPQGAVTLVMGDRPGVRWVIPAR